MTTWRLTVSGASGEGVDVLVDGDRSSAVASLRHQLHSAGFGHDLTLRGERLEASERLGELGLVHGDRLRSTNDTLAEPDRGPGTYLVAVSGPDAGAWLRITPSETLTVGRAPGTSLVVNDPLMSAQHAQFALDADGTMTVFDLGSKNGVYLEGRRVEQMSPVGPGDHVELGSTTLARFDVGPTDLATLPPPDGASIAFPRRYRAALAPLPEVVEGPRPLPTRSESNRALWVRALVPVVSGLGFALITGNVLFLAIMLVGPLIYVAEAYRERGRKAREEAEQRERHEAELDSYRQRLSGLRIEERRRRRASALTGGLGNLVAGVRHASLWERAPGDADYLSVAVGLADLPSEVRGRLEGTEPTVAMWATPLSIPLLQTGSLAITGATQRSRAVARSMLMNLCATHSPNDLDVWLLTDSSAEPEWSFVRWLPHAFSGTETSRVGCTDDQRRALLRDLRSVMETRRELGTGVHPAQVVVIDGVDLVDMTDLTELLRDGPAVGLIGICIDARLTPEGATGRLRLGATADGATFESRLHPHTPDVRTAEMSSLWADHAARSMAGLRPSAAASGGGEGSDGSLLGLLGSPELSAAAVGERWRASSPRTNVVIGEASGLPMEIDFVANGPHGLVGGTSGAGKTELLKTLISSLSLHNHPDDLSMLVVDFKGGLDYEQVRQLPHLLDVATNKDIELFRRTLQLLEAEKLRRQHLFTRCGAKDLDDYRTLRERNPDLPAVPRLLLIIDEFSELLASDSGREQLNELESTTRIGRALGIHLLLVTQTFSTALPAQIDSNAGMRICLRVESPGDSKVLLKSPIASTIPAEFVGRAYARLKGSAPEEFQTARITNRRTSSSDGPSPVRVRQQPFATLITATASVKHKDPPYEETDLAAVVDSVVAAAHSSGWREPAIPWTAALPDEVLYEDIHGSVAPGDIAIGMEDVPAEQRRAVTTLGERDEQVLLLGSRKAAIPSVLVGYAFGAALQASPDDLHLYGIDLLGSGLERMAQLPHCGAVATRNDRLGLRVLQVISDLAAQRKSAASLAGASDVWEAHRLGQALPPKVVLLVSGADRLLMQGETASSPLLGPLLALLADSAGTRIQVVLGGLQTVAYHRLGSNIDRRFVFHQTEWAEYSSLGVDSGLAAQISGAKDAKLVKPHRAVDVARNRVVQTAQFGDEHLAESEVLAKLAEMLRAQYPTERLRRPPSPLREVPWPLWFDQALEHLGTPPSELELPFPVGVRLADGAWSWMDADEDGPVLAIAGAAKSGRSSALVTLARIALDQGWGAVALHLSRRSPVASQVQHLGGHMATPEGLVAALERCDGDRPVLIVADDFQRLQSPELIPEILSDRTDVMFAMTGTPDFIGGRDELMRRLPTVRTGIVLAPTSSLDLSCIGVGRQSSDLFIAPRPGRGIIAIAGEWAEIQLPLLAKD